MSTVVEIKSAIDRLLPMERAELEALVGPERDRSYPGDAMPSGLKEKLAEAATGRFMPGDRANIDQTLASLE